MNETKVLHSLSEVIHFDWTDYFILVLMLIISAIIGVYFGCFGSGQKTVEEYILGGKKMKPIPIGLSLTATAISGITLIGVPSEIYTDGPTYWVVVISFGIVSLMTQYTFLPVFVELKVTSVYEYLELRFNRRVRIVTSVFFSISCLMYLPTVIYMPSISFSQVTGINMHIISTVITSVCVFYTMLGGLKAVVWTDFFQTLVTIGACLSILIIGTIKSGGFTHVMETAYRDGKLNIFIMDPNPFQRSSFWTVLVGTFVLATFSLGTTQSSVQRFISLKSEKDIKISLFVYWLGFTLFTTMSVYGGLLVYATYYGCDPIENKLVSRADQIFPYYVLDQVGHVPTLPGLFIAGVFSAALSTLSTALNTVAATVYEDCVKSRGVGEKSAHVIMKLITVAVGVFSVCMVFVIEKMGKGLSVSYVISSISLAPIYVIFLCGMVIPWINSKGAMAAAVSAAGLLSWISIGSSLNKVNFMSSSVYPINNCPYNLTTASVSSGSNSEMYTAEEDVFILYKLSYILYGTFGIMFGVIVGILVSFATGPNDPSTMNPVLIIPPLRKYLPANKQENNGIQAKVELMI